MVSQACSRVTIGYRRYLVSAVELAQTVAGPMMATTVLWLGVIGSWLLFAGPVYQAGLELRDHENAAMRLRRTLSSMAPPAPVSWWWWLIPPVKIMLEWRRAIDHRRAFMDALSLEEYTSLLTFIHKATGWWLVGMGGLLVAIQQSYGFAQRYHLGDPSFVASVVAIAVVCQLGCTLRLRLGERLTENKKRGAGQVA
jgi:hypothetical protein